MEHAHAESSPVQSYLADVRQVMPNSYQYRSLQHEDSIRILHIEPGEGQSPLYCHLEYARLQDEPYYVALSYTWGDPDKVMTVFMMDTGLIDIDRIEGSSITVSALSSTSERHFSNIGVTLNLLEALQAIRKADGVVKLWVDAICINQDDLEERSQQVRIMSRIYELASLVIVWLGLADEDSEMAFDWIEKACDCWLELSQQRKLAGIDEGSSQELLDWWELAQIDDEEVWWALRYTFTAFGDRKWWERKWVIQEQACAKKVLFSCGKRGLWQIALFSAISLLRDRNRIQPYMQLPEHDDVDDVFVDLLIRSVEYHLNWTSQTKGLQAPFTIEEAIAEAFYAKASDPRDEIYALLSVCHFPTRKIVPNYTKSVLAVHLEAAEVMIRDRQDLEPLCGSRVVRMAPSDDTLSWCAQEDMGVPSWLPDFRGAVYRMPNLVMPRFYQTSGNKNLDTEELFSQSTGTLVLRAIHFDHINAIGRSIPIDDDATELSEELYRDWMSANHHILRAEPSLPLHELAQLMCMDWSKSNLMDTARRLRPEDIDRMSRAYAQLDDNFETSAGDSSTEIEVTLAEVHVSTDESHYKNVEESAKVELRSRLRTNIRGQLLLCRMKSGRFGWVSTAAQVGDPVFVILGASVPFVLRPLPQDGTFLDDETGQSRDFTMIGTAYVQGIMDGELAADEAVVKVNERLIYLH